MPPIDGDRTLIHGPTTDGNYRVKPEIYNHLEMVSDLLNLKQHRFEWDNRYTPVYIHLSAFTQLHSCMSSS